MGVAVIAKGPGVGANPAVELDQVSKWFPLQDTRLHVLDRVCLSVHSGEFVAVLGPSGCGKSTLLNIVAGLNRPSAGGVQVHGRAVERPQQDLGLVFQDPLLLPWRTVLANIMLQAEFRKLPRAAAEQRALALLEQVGLSDFALAYPHQLSLGMQQRVSLCRALLHQPRLLLLDEPFYALDALTREQLGQELEQLWMGSGPTVIMVTHDITEAVRLADRVVVLSPRPARVAREVPVALPRPRYGRIKELDGITSLAGSVRGVLYELGVLAKPRQANQG